MEVIGENIGQEPEWHFISFLHRGLILNILFALSLNMHILITEVSILHMALKNYQKRKIKMLQRTEAGTFRKVSKYSMSDSHQE